MILQKGYLYRFDCSRAKNGNFYGIYLRTDKLADRHIFEYIWSEVIWSSDLFYAGKDDTHLLKCIGLPEDYPEYFV